MADEKIVVDDTQSDKDFDEGFTTSVVLPVTAAPAADAPAPVIDAPAPVVKEPVVDAAPPAAEPEYVKITKEQFASLEAAAAKVGDFDKKFDKAFGTVGGMQDIIKQLQASTPKGEAVVMSDEMFADMAEDYPDLAAKLRLTFEKVLKGAKGTGTASGSVDPSMVTKLVQDGIKAREIETLESEYPDWRETVNAVPSKEQADPKHPFRMWLATQDPAYQAKVEGTHSAVVLMKAIDKFKDATKTPSPAPKATTPKEAARRAVIKAAIPLKGDGNPPPPSKSDDDQFEAGFKSG